MHDVLAALEAFHQKAADIFDTVEGACGAVDDRLSVLEKRLGNAAARVEAARGSTRPLNVSSARLLNAPRSAERTKRLFDSTTLASLCNAAPLPEKMTMAPSSRTAAEDLARVVRCIAAPAPGNTVRPTSGRLLPAEGRIGSCAELFLFNSSEQPYRGGTRARYVDNLLAPDEIEIRAPSAHAPWMRNRPGQPELRLDEDEADPLMEDLRFRPAPAKSVVFELPDVLPDIGGPVADLMWREHDQLEHETQRPAWDSVSVTNLTRSGATSRRSVAHTPSVQRRDTAKDLEAAALMLQSRAGGNSLAPNSNNRPAAPVSKPAAPPPKAKAAPAAAAASPAAPKKGKGKGDKGAAAGAKPAGPPAAPKGKGKGKVKGPPPPKTKGAGPPPPAPKGAAPAGGGGKAAMFAALSKGSSGLKKVGPPKDRGPQMGRVL